MKLEEAIYDICDRYTSSGYYVGDTIPEDKLDNARMNFPIPPKEEVIALIDGTVFGTCKVGLAICLSGIRWKNDWTQETRKNYLTWDEFSKVKVSTNGLYKVQLGNGNFFNISGASIKKSVIVNLLNEIQELILSSYFKEDEVAIEFNSEERSSLTSPQLEKWLIAMDGEQYGPYDILKIKELVSNGQLKKEKSYVWKKGMNNWKFMSEVSEFKKIFEDETPPPLPPTF